MDINVNVKVSLTAETVTLLTALIGGVPAQAPAKTPVKNLVATAPAATSATEETVTKEMLQAFAKNNKTKRDAIVAVLGKFGAASISTAEEKDYPAIHAEFLKL